MSAAAVVTAGARFERRARLLPWGIHVETWRLVETRTFPVEAGGLPLAALLAEDAEQGAIPVARNPEEDTLENLIDEPVPERAEYESGDPTHTSSSGDAASNKDKDPNAATGGTATLGGPSRDR